jgi:amylosucrase
MYSVAFSVGGIPLVYMGDEVALPNDVHWEDDPAHNGDNRWMHRPPMDWGRVEAAEGGTGVAGRTLARLRRLVAERARRPALRSDTGIAILPMANPHVLGYRRGAPGEGLVALVNFSASTQVVGAAELESLGLAGAVLLHGTEGAEAPGVAAPGADVTVPACGFLWLGGEDGAADAR